MLDLTKDTLKGARKMANHCLMVALSGLYFQVARELKAADTQTNEGHQELLALETERDAPLGLQQERTAPGVWAALYFALVKEIATYGDQYSMPMDGAVAWDFITSSGSREYDVATEMQLQELADIMECSLEDIKLGRKAARVSEDVRRKVHSDTVLSLLATFDTDESVEDLEARLNVTEQRTMVSKYIEGLEQEAQRFLTKGLAFTLPDGMGTVALLKAGVKEGVKHLESMPKAEAA